MATEILMPALSPTMEEGTLAKWLVKEGDTVKSGQRIATLGRSGTQVEQLHFEIRRNGKPVDPIRFLPKQ